MYAYFPCILHKNIAGGFCSSGVAAMSFSIQDNTGRLGGFMSSKLLSAEHYIPKCTCKRRDERMSFVKILPRLSQNHPSGPESGHA